MNRLSVKMVAAGFLAMSLGVNVFGDDDLNYGHASGDYSRYRRECAQGHKETAKPIQQKPGRKVNTPAVNAKPDSKSTRLSAVPVAAAQTAQQKGKEQAELLKKDEEANEAQRKKDAELARAQQIARAEEAKLNAQARKKENRLKEEAEKKRLEQERQVAAERLAVEKLEAEKAEQAAAKLAEEALSQMQPTVSQPEQTNVTQGSWGKFIFGGAAIGVVAGVGLYFWRESSNNGSSGGGGK